MTDKSAFTDEEWKLVTEGPATAGFIVVTADRGGTFRETWALAREYAEERQHHGESELLDAIVSHRPSIDRGDAHTPEEVKDVGLGHLRQAVDLVREKATPDELDAYKKFVVDVATKVAHAHKEQGQEVSAPEQAALDEISAALS
jgi:hypothetical protein